MAKSRCNRWKYLSVIVISFASGCNVLALFQPGDVSELKIDAKRTGCSEFSLSTSFTVVGAEADRTYNWYFTDGVVRSGAQVVHTFEEAGEYVVTLDAGAQRIKSNIQVPVRGDADGGPDPFGDRCVPNEGDRHIPNDSTATYKSNPPASGRHYSAPGVSPADPGIYEEPLRPEIWLHNLEHGWVVVLYDCTGDCPQSLLDELQVLFDLTPPSKFGNKKLVITRYPDLQVPVMAIAWDVQRDFDRVDVEGILVFYQRRVDRGPEDEP